MIRWLQAAGAGASGSGNEALWATLGAGAAAAVSAAVKWWSGRNRDDAEVRRTDAETWHHQADALDTMAAATKSIVEQNEVRVALVEKRVRQAEARAAECEGISATLSLSLRAAVDHAHRCEAALRVANVGVPPRPPDWPNTETLT